jgi:RNA polymerase sigma-70 factor (ECF subfamily)
MPVKPVSGCDKPVSGGVSEKLTQLIAAIALGDEAALTALYDITRRQLYGLTLSILKDTALAEEVTLDVYLQVWREAARYQAERGSPLAWLVTLARSRALDRRRAIKSKHEQARDKWPNGDMNFSSDEGAIDAERARYVHAAIAQLTPEQRQAVALAYFEGLSHSEIAVRLAIPLGTVKTRIRHGMLRLQEILAPDFGEDRP